MIYLILGWLDRKGITLIFKSGKLRSTLEHLVKTNDSEKSWLKNNRQL
ncbi:MAG: hypothetical protein JWR09_52 [Mucilaginibacter sp.]|nr:hypothetical protein [Mucilaginibacter sp.]